METQPTNTQPTQDWAAVAAASAAAETERKQASKAPRSFREPMACKLSKEELVERGSQLAEALAEVSKLEVEKKNNADSFKARIELAESRARDLADVLRSRTETREVELIEEFVFATNTVRVTRSDTRELVRERAMTRAERQEELPLDAAIAKSAAVSAEPTPEDLEASRLDPDDADDDLGGDEVDASPSGMGWHHDPNELEATADSDITDPGAVLASETEETSPETPRARRGRKKGGASS